MSEIYENEDVIDESTEEIIPYIYSITSYGADYPVDTLVKRLEKKVIFIPPFQRSYVWKINQASRFVESLLLGLPVPGIFLSKEADGKLLVIDGHQRLKTLQFFYEGMFAGRAFELIDVQKKYDGKTYKTLEEADRRRLDDAIIHATIVKQDEPSDDNSSIYHIFERLNTGGNLLQPQEIRACIFQGPFNDFLTELRNNKSWQKIYGSPSIRLKDQELILRFFALLLYSEKYERPMKEFLNDYMGKNRKFHLHDKETLRHKFTGTIDIIANTLGKKAFRPERAINAAVFDAVMIGVARRLDKCAIIDDKTFVKKYYELLDNKDFIQACLTATSDEKNVSERSRIATEYFEDIL